MKESRELWMSDNRRAGEYLARMVQRKKAEVDNLLRRHSTVDDPLIMRMTYVNSNCKYEVTKAIKKPDIGADELGKMSIIVDVKRKSPTVPMRRDIVDYTNAGEFCQLLAKVKVDGLFLNTEPEYGGKFQELKDSKSALKRLQLDSTPALIHKDLIIHPIQVIMFYYNYICLFNFADSVIQFIRLRNRLRMGHREFY